MSFIKLQPENFDTFSLTLRPRTEFVSSSSGITGSVRLIERPSTFLKEEIAAGAERITEFSEGASTLDFVETIRNSMITRPTERDYATRVYLNLVNALSVSRKNDIVIPVERITQSIDFDRNSFTKSTIKNVLMPQYHSVYTDCQYSYKNYHTINFFTASTVPSDSAIMYPNVGDAYTLLDGFTFDFYINPRYLADAGTEFNAGSILHMSSSFCLSLLTGSHKNADSQTDQFRLAVAFKHSANIPLSAIDVNTANGSRSYPQDLIYISDDNMLKHNHWHHVTVRWAANSNNRTGSFQVDNITSSFYYPSGTVTDAVIPQVLFMGNQYVGADDTRKFFNSTTAYNLGLTTLDPGISDPTLFTLNSPLNAEIHDVKIYKRYITTQEVFKNAGTSPGLTDPGLSFYVPPFFTNSSIKEQFTLQTPTSPHKVTPYTPYNKNVATQAQVFYPNVQNFLVDLKNPDVAQPRLYGLEPVIVATAGEPTAADHLFVQPQYAKRVYTVLPNDNGKFIPNYDFILTASSIPLYQPYKNRYTEDKTEISLESVDNDIAPGSLGIQTVEVGVGRSYFMSPTSYLFLNTRKQNDALNEGNLTTLLSFSGSDHTGSNARFADRSSNLSTIYQISNLYYGNQIFPESFTISSTALTGSGGKVNITLKDNGFGGLYRADAVTPPPTWATVGNLFYDEGLAIIKTPHLYYFGKDNFSVSFNGSQNIHTYTIDAICPAGEINSSSNPSYLSFPPTNEQNETADNFVYITGINIHDDNFNVIMRANLAQPVLKRPDEEFLFRIKYDM